MWRLGQVMDTKFGTNVSNEMLLNAAKYQGTAFTIFEFLRENHLGGKSSSTHTHTHTHTPTLGLKLSSL